MQLLLIIDHIVPLIENHNRVMDIDSNTISDIAAENGSVGKTNDVTLLYEISRGIVRTEVVRVAELIRIFNVRIEKLFNGQIVEELAFGVIENVLTALWNVGFIVVDSGIDAKMLFWRHLQIFDLILIFCDELDGLDDLGQLRMRSRNENYLRKDILILNLQLLLN